MVPCDTQWVCSHPSDRAQTLSSDPQDPPPGTYGPDVGSRGGVGHTAGPAALTGSLTVGCQHPQMIIKRVRCLRFWIVVRAIGLLRPGRPMAVSKYIVNEQRDDTRHCKIRTELFEPVDLALRKPDLHLLIPLLPDRQRRQVRVRCTAAGHSLSSHQPTRKQPTGLAAGRSSGPTHPRILHGTVRRYRNSVPRSKHGGCAG